jgi:hypothetical protein
MSADRCALRSTPISSPAPKGVNGPQRQTTARQILADHEEDDIVGPVQALAELCIVLTTHMLAQQGPRHAASAAASAL